MNRLVGIDIDSQTEPNADHWIKGTSDQRIKGSMDQTAVYGGGTVVQGTTP